MSAKKSERKAPLILGHRGYRKLYPENTEIAFEKAIEYGADGIEFDVQKTCDGEFVIFHDYETERLTGLKGNVEGFSRRELVSFKVQGKEEIPDLKQYLLKSPADRYYNMELKEETVTKDDCPAIYEMIKDLKKRDRILISSFRHDLLPYFKERNFQIGLLLERRDTKNIFLNLMIRMYRMKPEYLNLPVDLFARIPSPFRFFILKTFRLMGYKIAFWTVNNEDDFRKICRYSDIIITDDVEKITALKEGIKW